MEIFGSEFKKNSCVGDDAGGSLVAKAIIYVRNLIFIHAQVNEKKIDNLITMRVYMVLKWKYFFI